MQFGLKLIQKNTGQTRFELGAEAVKDPDKYLSDLVVRSYRGEAEGPEGAPDETSAPLPPPDPRPAPEAAPSRELFYAPVARAAAT